MRVERAAVINPHGDEVIGGGVEVIGDFFSRLVLSMLERGHMVGIWSVWSWNALVRVSTVNTHLQTDVLNSLWTIVLVGNKRVLFIK